MRCAATKRRTASRGARRRCSSASRPSAGASPATSGSDEMDLNYSPEDVAFRKEVRAFIDANLDPAVRAKVKGDKKLEKQDFVTWQKALHRKGWIAPNWPSEYGGPGWTPTQRHIFEEELAYGHCPRIIPFGLKMVAPVIMKFGNQAQKNYYLPRIL